MFRIIMESRYVKSNVNRKVRQKICDSFSQSSQALICQMHSVCVCVCVCICVNVCVCMYSHTRLLVCKRGLLNVLQVEFESSHFKIKCNHFFLPLMLDGQLPSEIHAATGKTTAVSTQTVRCRTHQVDHCGKTQWLWRRLWNSWKLWSRKFFKMEYDFLCYLVHPCLRTTLLLSFPTKKNIYILSCVKMTNFVLKVCQFH